MAKVNKAAKRTELGRELAKLRIDFDESRVAMAKKLGVSPATLFNIETGQTGVAYEIIEKVKNVYKKDLTDTYVSTVVTNKITLNLDNLTDAQREAAVLLWKISEGILDNSPDVHVQRGASPGVELNKIGPDSIWAEPPVDYMPAEIPNQPGPIHRPPPLPDDVGFIDDD